MTDESQRQIHVTVKNKQDIIFDDFVKAVSSFNEQGVFDILPMHENFISIIKNVLIIHQKTGDKYEIKVTDGVLKAYENNINIYIGPGNK